MRGVFPYLAHHDTFIHIFFWGAPEFQGAYHMLFSLSHSLAFFISFSKWILLLLMQVKHKRMLYRFLL